MEKNGKDANTKNVIKTKESNSLNADLHQDFAKIQKLTKIAKSMLRVEKIGRRIAKNDLDS
jgi:hypothetical protein